MLFIVNSLIFSSLLVCVFFYIWRNLQHTLAISSLALLGIFFSYFYLGHGLAPIHLAEAQARDPLITLQEQLRQNPQDPALWQALGKAYLLNHQYKEAYFCYLQTHRYGTERAEIYAAQASALYYLEQQKITSHIQQLLDRALALDPDETTALNLIAADAFLSNDYPQAYRIWHKLLESHRPEVNRPKIIANLDMLATFYRAPPAATGNLEKR